MLCPTGMDFKLTARLGRGRTVESFAGVMERDGARTSVVVKRPRPELAGDQTFADALIGWGQSQIGLDHPNMVSVLASGRDDQAYVVQERIFGGSLARLLSELRQRKRTLRPDLAFSIALQIADAVAAMHRYGHGPHGGIDPNEILIGHGGEVKIGDQKLHSLDALAGTEYAQSPTYLAPEVAADTDVASVSGDVYAIALTALEMLIGMPVWRSGAMTVEASVRALKDFSHVGQVQPALTDDLVTVLGMCLEPRVENRFPSAHEVYEELRRIARKNELAPDEDALGAFVRAALPQPEADQAPTMLVAVQHSDPSEDVGRRPDFRAASVMIDPEFERIVASDEERPSLLPSLATPSSAAADSSAPVVVTRNLSGPGNAWKILTAMGLVALVLLILLLIRRFGLP